MTARVVIVVVTWNSGRHLPGLIRSLPDALGPLEWQLVVADNASSDDSVELVGRLAPQATVVEVGRNAGYAAAINAGARAARPHDALLVLNPDVRLHAGAVPRLFGQLRGDVGITVPRLVDQSGALHHSLRRDPTLLRAWGEAVLGGDRAARLPLFGERVVGRRAYAAAHDVDWATGAALLVSRACAETTGAWDESFFLYSEETDYAQRARRAGFRIRYVPEAVAVHAGGDAHVSPQLWAVLTRNRVRLYRRGHGRLASGAFWVCVVLNEALRAAVGRRTSRSALAELLLPGSRTG
jgi:N-acetylglucosaminyl-diphospho-decaprenol L-rhamnosyltransferase